MGDLIRRCTADDAEALAAIYDPIVSDTFISFEEKPPGPDDMRRRLSGAGDAYPWLVCESAGWVAGYAYAAAHRARAAYRWSVDVSVYVAPSARGRGVGSRLYRALFQTLVAQGYCAVYAGVTLPNEASRRLHTSVGFVEVGVYHAVGFKFGAWHDVAWFERRLRQTAEIPAEPRSLSEFERVPFEALLGETV